MRDRHFTSCGVEGAGGESGSGSIHSGFATGKIRGPRTPGNGESDTRGVSVSSKVLGDAVPHGAKNLGSNELFVFSGRVVPDLVDRNAERSSDHHWVGAL